MVQSDIKIPTLVLSREICETNISRMTARCSASGITLRPHFKTHQSREVGRWFRSRGVDRITVSSVTMANYFAEDGWDDILIAFPFNPREISEINTLARSVDLTITVPNAMSATILSGMVTEKMSVMIKTDTGYGRSGIRFDNKDELKNISEIIDNNRLLNLKGLLTHAGNTYKAESRIEITDRFNESIQRLNEAKLSIGIDNLLLSAGDTPSAGVIEKFSGFDELRAGNFVFNDLMQYRLGSCSFDDISVALACPVVDIQPDRNRVVIYGGAVHLSKEAVSIDGKAVFGMVTGLNGDGTTTGETDIYVTGLSQEHGIIEYPSSVPDDLRIGDLLLVIPVHSCLTADLCGKYLLTSGKMADHLNCNSK